MLSRHSLSSFLKHSKSHCRRPYTTNANGHRLKGQPSSFKSSPYRMHVPRIETYYEPDKSVMPYRDPDRVHQTGLENSESKKKATGKQHVQFDQQAVPQWLESHQAFVQDLKSGEKIDLVDLDPYYFRVEARKDVLHRVVVWQLANRRRGTKKTLSRYENAYSKKKMAPQKGRGAARRGSRGSPLLVGGGHAHPVQPKDWSHKLNKKERLLALRMAISLKLDRNELHVVKDLDVEEGKTRKVARMLHENFGVNARSSALIVDGHTDSESGVHPLFERGSWNLHYVDTVSYKGLNVYDLLHRKKLIITESALAKLTTDRKDRLDNTLSARVA